MTSTTDLKNILAQDLIDTLGTNIGTVTPLLLQGPPGIGMASTYREAAQQVSNQTGLKLKTNPTEQDAIDHHDLVLVDVEMDSMVSIGGNKPKIQDLLKKVIDQRLAPAGGGVLRISVGEAPDRAQTLQDIDHWFGEHQDLLHKDRILVGVVATGPKEEVTLTNIKPVQVTPFNLSPDEKLLIDQGQRTLVNRVTDLAINEQIQQKFPSLNALREKLDAQATTADEPTTSSAPQTRRQP